MPVSANILDNELARFDCKGSEIVVKTILLDGSGSQIVSFGGGCQYTEGDIDASITGTAFLMEDSNTLQPVQGTVAGGLLVNLGSNNDVSLNAGTNCIGDVGFVDSIPAGTNCIGDVGIVGSVTADTELPAASALADNTANPTVPGVGAFAMVWDGATWDRAPGTSADGLLVNLGSNNDVTQPTHDNFNANANIQVGNTDVSTSNPMPVQGNAAHDSAVSGNPQLVGFEARTTNPTAVGNGDAVRAMSDDVGRQVVVLNSPRDLETSNTVNLMTATETTILSAGGAGVFHDLVDLDITNASSESTCVDIRDDTAGAVIMSFDIAPKGGVVKHYTKPWSQTAANDNWTAQLSNGDADVRINIRAVQNV